MTVCSHFLVILGSLDATSDSIYGPSLPNAYIKIAPHPHSIDTTTVIIPLTNLTHSASSSNWTPRFIPKPSSRPWAPFTTLDDFKYTETAVIGLLSNDVVDAQLSGFNSQWAKGGSRLTIRNHTDMKQAIARARKYVVQVNPLRSFNLRIFISLMTVSAWSCVGTISRKNVPFWFSVPWSLGIHHKPGNRWITFIWTRSASITVRGSWRISCLMNQTVLKRGGMSMYAKSS